MYTSQMSYGHTTMHADASFAPACQSACRPAHNAASVLSVLDTAVMVVSILILPLISILSLISVRILEPCMVKP